MSTVALTIGPKSYSVACADGEEAHVAMLGAMVAERYQRLGSARAPLEAQNLLFAALFLADELAEAGKQAEAAERAKAAAAPPASASPAPTARKDDTLESEVVQLRAENARLAAALAEAARPAPLQADLFGTDAAESFAKRLEALAEASEGLAGMLEASLAGA